MIKHRLKLLIGLVTAVLCVASMPLVAQFGGGDGSEENPYIISTPGHLDEVRNYPDAHFRQTADIDLIDIWNWEPLELVSPATYDGCGYVINNMTIDRSNSSYVGLFGTITGVTISRVSLSSVNVTGGDYVGGLVGNNYNGIIEQCSVTGGSVLGNDYVGGLVGINENGVISNCFTRVYVEGNSWVAGMTSKQNNGNIINSYASGSVNSFFQPIGGLVAYLHPPTGGGRNSFVSSSYWDVDTTGQLYSDGGESRTTEEMTYPYSQNTFVGWDFLGTWRSDENHLYNDGYPLLGLFAGGQGTGMDPYLISSPNHLHNVRYRKDASFKQISNINLDAFPYNVNEGWNPIGDFFIPFTGNYDGNGHTINNLMINRPTDDFQGLFGSIKGSENRLAIIRDLDLLGVNIKGSMCIGGLAGDIRYGYIDNVSVSGSLKGTNQIGGIAGFMVSKSYCVRCEADVKIGTVDTELALQGGCGGLIGYAVHNGYSRHNLYINECFANVDICPHGNNPLYYAGGLIGRCFGAFKVDKHIYRVIITNSSSNVLIDGNSQLGGLIGENSCGLIQSCFSRGTVVGLSEEIGGLIGCNSGTEFPHAVLAYGEIRNSYSVVSVEGGNKVGGLAGINKSYGSVENSYSSGLVEDGNNTGGLIGDNQGVVLNSFWDVESSGQATSAGGIGLTTYQMMNYYSFDNWAFTMGYGTPPVWINWSTKNWSPYVLKSYPYLYWQGEPGAHNYPDFIDGETHVKYFVDDRITHWESFPRLEEEDDWDYTEELLEQVLNGNDGIYSASNWNPEVQWPNYMNYNYDENEWYPTGQGVTLNNLDGFFFDFVSPPSNGYMRVSGNWSPRTKIITLEDHMQVHWIGYPYRQTQSLFNAILPFEQYIELVRGQDGGIYRDGDGNWFAHLDTNVYYGKMYEIAFKESPYPVPYAIEFTWAAYRNEEEEDFDYVDYHFNRPRPQYFSFTDSRHYEEFFIEDIENDEGLLEIGAFVGEECVGAALFTGKYPVRLMAYTDERHAERELSFKLHRGTRSDSQDHIKLVEVKNEQTGIYEQKVVQSLQQKYARIRLGVDDYTETVPVPQITMGQNYPNPFVASSRGSSEIRTRSENVIATSIPVYLPKDMDVNLSVFNIKGQRVKTLTSGNLTSGNHVFTWDGNNEQNQPVSAGVYFYRLECDIETVNKKMLIVR